MKRIKTVLAAAGLVALLSTLAWLALKPSEPAYQGKPLSAWIDQYQTNSWAFALSRDDAELKEAQDAICQMATNSFPALIRMAAAKDSPLKKKVLRFVERHSNMRLPLHSADYYHARATYGFGALGPAAKPTVPSLINLLRDEDAEVRASAAQCLSLIGPDAAEAVPALLTALNAAQLSDGRFLIAAMMALGAIHSDAEHVVPVLLQYVDGSRKDWNYSPFAMNALGSYREKAKSAVPAIIPYLKDPDPSRRQSADAALLLIDPELARTLASKKSTE